jgi:transcriptional regulator with XRE-family HTH domain
VIRSKLATGKAPRIVRALGFTAHGVQDGLRTIDLLGNMRYPFDPYADDFYLFLIRAREDLKRERDQQRRLGNWDRARQIDAEQKAIKLIANSATHGIFLETNLVPVSPPALVRVYSGWLAGDPEPVDNLERPGSYFHPLLSTIVTSAGRLMLGIAEELVYQEELDWALCDTDSIVMVQPDLMGVAEFLARTNRLRAWFETLSPAPDCGEFLEIKDENRAPDGSGRLQPLLCIAISSKQHVLFNLDESGETVIRKATVHGLGHLVTPYTDSEAPSGLPAPTEGLNIARWQHDLWFYVVRALRERTPNRVLYTRLLPGFKKPAARVAVVTTPEILSWFESLDDEDEPIRPFERMLAFYALRDGQGRELSPVARYHPDATIAARSCSDRRTGEQIPVESLKTYEDVLGSFQMRSEPKLMNARHRDAGTTTLRRHIIVESVDRIGKDSHQYEEQRKLGYDPTAHQEYTSSPDDTARLLEQVRAGCRELTMRSVANAAEVDVSKVSRMLRGKSPVTVAVLRQLLGAIDELRVERRHRRAEATEALDTLRDLVESTSVTEAARRLGVARSLVSQVLSGRRSPSPTLTEALVHELSRSR